MISIIVAMTKNRIIGNKNTLPWNIPEDLVWFKNCTMGKPIVMGRKTHLSIGRILKGRDNIVLSQNSNFVPINSSAKVYNNIEAVLRDYNYHKEVMIIGGEQIYKHFLPYASRIYITIIDSNFDGDAYFPELNNDWKLMYNKQCNNKLTSYSFNILEKCNGNS